MVDINSFALFTDAQAIKFLEDQLSEILEDPKIDILGKLKIRLLCLPILERDDFKKKLLEFLKYNNSSLTTQLITTASGMKLPPTVSNWLNDYLSFVGDTADKSKKEEYFQKSQSYQTLGPDDRQILKRLLELFDFIKVTSVLPEGLEEEIVVKDREGKFKLLKKGEFIDLTRPQAPFRAKSPVPLVPKIEKMPEEPAPKAAFYFHPEDEEEFKKHREMISQFELPKTHSVDQVVEEIIQENNLTFSDEILKSRFSSIIKARLKEIRGVIDTKDLLTRSEKIGGMGYEERLADQIIDTINQKIPKMHELVDESEIEKEAIEMAPKIPSLEIPKPPLVPQPRFTETGVRVSEIIKPREEMKKVELPEYRPTVKPRVMPQIIRPEAEPTRPRIEDIKKPVRLVGPVEELRSLSLSDLRRLGSAYIGSIRKLYEKINLLGEESFAKRAEGINAWRQSSVYQLYLEMGQESMEMGKTVREVVVSRQNQGFPYLTEQEFNGLADMNKRLRF